MNVGLALVLSVAALLAAYFVYGRLVGRWLGVDPGRPTPASTVNDGQDYVPTKPVVLFGHHFASIAAAGPIVGPTLAVLYGFLPAWLWILVGVIFIGAVHDFAALFLAVREGGRSVAEVARTTLGTGGFVLYVLFALLLCFLVSAAFLWLAVEALTSHYALADLDLAPDQTIFGTMEVKRGDVVETHALTGGIATVSVIVITLAAPLVGWLLYKKGLSSWKGSLLAIVVCGLSLWLGFENQLRLDPGAEVFLGLSLAQVVLGILLAYCFAAASFPVWLVLQPRDFVNVHLLYVGLAAMVLGILACGFQGVTISAPAADLEAGAARMGMVWPFLFVTIACGACSGAHGLVCGGTTCKQLANERHAPAIGYGAMLLEALLGLCVIFMIVGPMGFDQYRAIVWPAGVKGNFAVRGFALAVGRTLNMGFGLPIHHGTIFGVILLEGFVLTTVDTIVRLSRYLLEELWRVVLARPPAWLLHRGTNTFLAIAVIALLAYTNGYGPIWPVFGAANQLLAALTLVAAAVWLVRRSRKKWFVVLPAVFMTATTVTSLVLLVGRHLLPDDPGQRNWTLSIADGVLLALAAGVLFLAARKVLAERRERGYNPAART